MPYGGLSCIKCSSTPKSHLGILRYSKLKNTLSASCDVIHRKKMSNQFFVCFFHQFQLTSNSSMSFLRDENLTFHRFATDDSRRPSEDLTGSTRHNTMATNTTDRHENNFPPNVWTTSTSSSKSNFTMDTNEFQYIPGGVHDISSKNLTLANGSTAKLLPADDQSNKQVR